MYGYDILCEIWKVPFEIPHKISYPYIERYDFYTTLKCYELLDSRAHMCFWNTPGHQQPWHWPILSRNSSRNTRIVNFYLIIYVSAFVYR